MDRPSTDKLGSELADLTGLNISDLEELIDSESVLARSVQRILREAGRPDEAIAGFQSSI